MPTLLQETVVAIEFADLHNRQPVKRPKLVSARTPGVHLSGVLKIVGEAIGAIPVGEPLEEEMPLRMLCGVMWEEFAASMYPAVDWQPGEVTIEDVHMTCDGLAEHWLGGAAKRKSYTAPMLWESKATWKRALTGAEFCNVSKNFMWLMQGAGYCHGYGPRLVEWHVYYVMGDYRGSGPIYKKYLVEFSDKEVDQAWTMVMRNRHLAVPE